MYRQQAETQQGFFPGYPGYPGGNIERRLNSLERTVARNTREIERLERRVRAIERRLNIPYYGYGE